MPLVRHCYPLRQESQDKGSYGARKCPGERRPKISSCNQSVKCHVMLCVGTARYTPRNLRPSTPELKREAEKYEPDPYPRNIMCHRSPSLWALLYAERTFFRWACASCSSIRSGCQPCSLRRVLAVERNPCAVASYTRNRTHTGARLSINRDGQRRTAFRCVFRLFRARSEQKRPGANG